jgi:hypothetical protein
MCKTSKIIQAFQKSKIFKMCNTSKMWKAGKICKTS